MRFEAIVMAVAALTGISCGGPAPKRARKNSSLASSNDVDLIRLLGLGPAELKNELRGMLKEKKFKELYTVLGDDQKKLYTMLRDDQMFKLAEDEKIWSEIVAVAMMGLANGRVRQWYIDIFWEFPERWESNHRLIEELMNEMITNKIGEAMEIKWPNLWHGGWCQKHISFP